MLPLNIVYVLVTLNVSSQKNFTWVDGDNINNELQNQNLKKVLTVSLTNVVNITNSTSPITKSHW